MPIGAEIRLPPSGRSVSPGLSRTTSLAGAHHVTANMPSAPAFETAAASWGTPDIGTWTIGCSIPSNVRTVVRTIIDYLLVPTGSAGNQPRGGSTWPAQDNSTFSYDLYEDGID